MDKKVNPTKRIIEDSIIAGILQTFPEIIAVVPEKAPTGRIHYQVIGDIEGALSKIYQNHPVGALDVLKAIKAARQAIFNFRGERGRNGYVSR